MPHREHARTEKLAVTLPAKTVKFIDQYRKAHALKSRDEVVEIALALLRESEREADESEAPESDQLSDLDALPAEDSGRDRW